MSAALAAEDRYRPIAELNLASEDASVGAMATRLLSSVATLTLNCLLVVATLLVAALLTFLPLAALPGDFQTDFVNAYWVKFAAVGLVGAVATSRLATLRTPREQLTWLSGLSFGWRVVSTFLIAFWPLAMLAWLNAYGVQGGRTHDMKVTGVASFRTSPGGTAVETYKLIEPGTGWTSDLEVTGARDAFAQPGACIRITVREGRLGLDWISDAVPITCEGSARSRGP